MIKKIKLAMVLVVVTLLPACASNSRGNVSMSEQGSREHLEAKLNMTDVFSVADKLTNKMLSTPLIDSWRIKPPKLAMGRMINCTDEYNNFQENDIFDRVKGLVLTSGVAKVVDKKHNDYDYILMGKVSSTVAYGNGREQRQYAITLEILNPRGDSLGLWYDTSKNFIRTR